MIVYKGDYMNLEHLVKDTLEQNGLLDNFPTDYLDTLIKSVNIAFDIFKDDILSITLGGSGGKNLIHEGWSDLDLYFILKEFSINKICKCNEELDNIGKIHVGTSFYTLLEVENDMVSVNTKVMIYEKYKYNLNPTIYGKDYFKPISYQTIRNYDVYNLPNILFEYKRMIFDLKNEKTVLNRLHIKKMLILIKSVLNYHNIFSFGYEEVILKYTRLCKEKGFNSNKSINIIILIDDYENIENYKNQFIDFSEDIFKFIQDYC